MNLTRLISNKSQPKKVVVVVVIVVVVFAVVFVVVGLVVVSGIVRCYFWSLKPNFKVCLKLGK